MLRIFEFKIGEGDNAITHFLDTNEALLVIGKVYGFTTDQLFKKPLSSIQYWLKKASKSKKMTASNLIYIESVLEKKDVKPVSIFTRFLGIFKR